MACSAFEKQAAIPRASAGARRTLSFVLAVFAWIALSSCTSDHASGAEGDMDGGSRGASTKIGIRTAASVRVVARRLTPLSFHVDRAGGATPVTVVAEGLPAGVTAMAVELAADASEGVVTFAVDETAREDLFLPIVLRATSGSLFANAGLTLVAVGAPGSLDKSFASGGIQTLGPFELRTPDVRGVSIGPDGSATIVWALRSAANVDRLGIWRLRPDGTVDPGFNGGRLLEIPRDGIIPHGVVRLADGGALVYGTMAYAGTYWAMLTRITSQGTLDRTFGGDPQPGLARFSFDQGENGPGGSSTNEIIAGTALPGVRDEIVLTGRIDDLAALAQVDRNGTFSSTFAGIKPARFTWTSPLHWRSSAVDVRADGLRAILGTSDGAALTFLVDGDGSARPATAPILVDGQAGATGGVAWLSDGSLLTVTQRASSLRVRRIDALSLAPHAGFTEPTLADTGANAVVGVVAVPGERAVIGSADVPTRGASLTRMQSDGSLDTTFGTGGRATIDLYDPASLGSTPSPTHAVLAAGGDGRLVIVAGPFVGRVWNDP